MITDEQMARVDRRVYSVVHGKKVILDELMAAGKGWNHTSGHTYHHQYDQWVRGPWKLRVEWSEGGRIHGASLHEDQIDPDTGRIRVRGDGTTATYLRLGMVASERQKKERLVKLLSAPPDKIKDAINEINAARIEDDRKREAKRKARDDEWDEHNLPNR